MPSEQASPAAQLRLAGRRRQRLRSQLADAEAQLREAVAAAWPGMTHRKLAELAGVSHGTVQNWIRAGQGGDS